nr:HAD family phosphatase [bacterium]
MKNIVFDFGNVLGRFDPAYIAAQYTHSPQDGDALCHAVFDEWALIDAGALAYDAYIARCCARLPLRLHQAAQDLFATWHKHLPPIPGVLELLPQLVARGNTLYLLSNAPVHFARHTGEFPFLKLFSGLVISAELGMAKPDAAIYRYLLDTYHLAAADCLFIDDRADNVAAAKALGMDGYIFNGDAGLLKKKLML